MSDLENEPAGELVRRAVGQLRELMRVEVALAKREASRQARQLVASVIGFALALALLSGAFGMAIAAAFLAVGPSVVSAALIAGTLAAVALGVAVVAVRWLPKRPMARTSARVEHELEDVKEAVAS